MPQPEGRWIGLTKYGYSIEIDFFLENGGFDL